MCVGDRVGGNCDLDSASSRVEMCHMAEERRLSGQNSGRNEREGKIRL